MIGTIILVVWGALWALTTERAIRGGTWRDGLRLYWPHMTASAVVYGVANSIVSMRVVPAWVASLVLILLVAWCWAVMREAWVGCTRVRESFSFAMLTIPAGSLASGLAMRTGNGNVLPGWFWLAMGILFWSVMIARSIFRAPGRARNIASAIAAGIPALVAAICTVVMFFNMIGGAIGNARVAAAMRAAETSTQGEAAQADKTAESGGIGSWVSKLDPRNWFGGGNSESDDKAAEPDGEDTAQTPDGAAVQNADADTTSPYNNGAAGTPSAADAAAAEPAPAPVTSAVPSDADLGLGGRGSVAELKAQIPDYCHFYNLDLQENDGSDDDLNFAPNPYTESWTVDDYDRDFRAHLYLDPAAAAANVGYADAMTGNRYMGQFYDEVGSSWAAAINLAKDRFMADNAVHRETVKQFFNFLNRGTASIRWAKEGEVQDIMYQNPFTVSGVPDVIVLETGSMAGLLLEYTIPIKGRNITISYRVGCGYQPVNPNHKANMEIPVTTAEKVYEGTGKAVPQSYKKTSTPAPSTKSTTPAASSSGSGSKPSPSSSSSGSGAKDPSKGTPAGANKSGSGSGRNTNSGAGSRTSAADKPASSTTAGLTSQPAANANKPVSNGGQKTGNDSAAVPSTAVPGAVVQNNGETGNTRDGSAPIRTETPVAAPATTGGAPIANSGSGAAANGHAELPED